MKKHTNKHLRPESQMMSYGYNPFWSEGAIKPPIFQTSTFEFATAESGKQFFAKAYGKIDEINEPMGLIYSRLNNPNLEIFEQRLSLWDKAEESAVFASGMAAISSTLMAFTKPGDYILSSIPVYGGTNFFMENILTKYGIETIFFTPEETKEDILARIDKANARNKIAIVYAETPANPTNQLIDLDLCKEIVDTCNCDGQTPIFAVDNTFMGPIWQQPKKHGADIILYSATKYIGGHSDIIAGAASGSHEHMAAVKGMRTFLGNMPSPQTASLLTRSLETLKVRMEAQAANAKKVAEYLSSHPMVEKIYYFSMIENHRDQEIFDRHFSSTGAMISFDILGGEKEAFQFLNSLTLIKLAVSLGGTESLAQHPQTMTHTDMNEELKALTGVNEKLVRISIGLEHYQDIIDDLEHAFLAIQEAENIQ